MLQRRHFRTIANIISAAAPEIAALSNTETADAVCDIFARSFADFCASSNPRFDRDHFLKACGVAKAGVVKRDKGAIL
jgi:hypothetical protein